MLRQPLQVCVSVLAILALTGCNEETESSSNTPAATVEKTGPVEETKPATAEKADKPEAIETQQTETATDAATPEASTETATTSEPKTEAEGETRVTAQNPEALLSDPATLQADTIAAASHDRRESKIPYIGAWAADAPGCKLIDQDVYDSFTIITPDQIRSFEEICSITAAPVSGNPETLEASCQAEGETYQSKIIIEMINGENMKLKHEGTSGFELTRCYLPN